MSAVIVCPPRLENPIRDFLVAEIPEAARQIWIVVQESPHDVGRVIERVSSLKPTPTEIGCISIRPKHVDAICKGVEAICKGAKVACTFQESAFGGKVVKQQLLKWLGQPSVAKTQANSAHTPPKEAFEDAVAKSGGALIMASGALARISDLNPARSKLASDAAVALLKYAKADASVSMPLDTFFKNEASISFAQNGPVGYRVRFRRASSEEQVHTTNTEWHLKAGDNADNDNTLRIYFLNVAREGVLLAATDELTRIVVVLYCGPHPKNGNYDAWVDVPRTQ